MKSIAFGVGGKLVRFAPSGQLDRVVGLPVESTTSLSFGGPDLDIAFVTSMARTVKRVKPKEREARGLFAVYGLGVRGMPEPRFAGWGPLLICQKDGRSGCVSKC